MDLLTLSQIEHEDSEYVPNILPVDAKVSFGGSVAVLQRLFSQAAAVIPAKEVISGTSMIRVDVHPETKSSLAYLSVTSTDGDMTLSLHTDGVVVRLPGSANLPGRKVSDILKLCPAPTVQLDVIGLSVIIRSGRAQWTVKLPPEVALGPLRDFGGVPTHTLQSQGLLRALAVARRAASTSSSRSSLMQLDVRGGHVTGLDGARLHRHVIPGLPSDVELTIPLRAAEEMLRLLQSSTAETVEFGGTASHTVLRVGQHSLSCQRLVVPFPDVSGQMRAPQLTNTHSLTVERSALSAAIKRIRVNADPDFQALFLTILPGASAADGPSWSLVVSAQDRDGNAAKELLDVVWSGPAAARTLCANHRMLSDLLAATTQDFLVLKLGDDTKTVRHPLFVDDSEQGFTGWLQQMNASLVR